LFFILGQTRFSGAAYLGTPTVYMSDEEENGAAVLGTGSVSINSAAATATVDTLNPSASSNTRSKYQNFDILDDDSSDEDYEEPVSKPRRTNSSGYSTRTTNNSLSSAYMTRSSSLPINGTSQNKTKINKVKIYLYNKNEIKIK